MAPQAPAQPKRHQHGWQHPPQPLDRPALAEGWHQQQPQQQQRRPEFHGQPGPVAAMQRAAATGPQGGEAVHRHQGGDPAPEGRPGQHDRHDGAQAGQGRRLEQQQQHQGLGAAGANAAIPHGLKAAIARGQSIGRVHGPIHVETATQQQTQGQHQGHLG